MSATIRDRLALAGGFAGAARSYWLYVFPHVCREIRQWRERACQIPDPALRDVALATQQVERGNLEGAAAFAVLAPRSHRASVVRALVAYQVAYDYVDALAEQPSTDPARGAHQLHLALLTALGAGSHHPDYYAHHPRREDGGYVRALSDTCRNAFRALPSYAAIAAPALRAGRRMVAYQTLNHVAPGTSHDALAHWASAQTPAGTELRWWETAAGAASSLGAFALIASAAEPAARANETIATEGAYFPWIGALHVLLDSIIDQPEDVVSGRHSLVGHYASSGETARRMKSIAAHAIDSTKALPNSTQHAIILAAMTSFYLSARQASTPRVRLVAEEVLDTMGDLAMPATLVHRVRRACRHTGSIRLDHH